MSNLFDQKYDILYVNMFSAIMVSLYIIFQMSVKLMKDLLSLILTDQCIKTKYHIMETVFLILQLSDRINDMTANCVCAISRDFIKKFFTSDFQVFCL